MKQPVTTAIAMLIIALAITAAGCNPVAKTPAGADQTTPAGNNIKGAKRPMNLIITSPAFKDSQPIPRRHTCDGENISPAIEWIGVPAAAKSLALIADDPDAPVGTWVHWVVYSIPPSSTGFSEGVPPDRTLTNGAKQGTNDFRKIGYGGPCPPSGTHRYFFKLYALDFMPKLEPGATKADIEKLIRGHTLDQAQLIGTYKRHK